MEDTNKTDIQTELERILKNIRQTVSCERQSEEQKKAESTQTSLTSTFDCPECEDTGIIFIDRETARQCECVREKALKKQAEKLLQFANIPVKFKQARVNSFQTDIYSNEENKRLAAAAKMVAVNYINNFIKIESMGKGLYFHSTTPGSGKSSLAAAIGNAILNLFNKSVKFMTVEQMATEIKSTFNKDSDVTEKDLKIAVKEVDVLILDDLGVEKTTEWVESILDSVIRYRNDENKVTIFTANLSVDELPYHPRVKSRISRMATEVKFPEEDVRKRIAEKENDDLMKILYS